MADNYKILLTIDVEDWFQVENLRPWFPASNWHHQMSRVEFNTKRLLDLFEEASLRLNRMALSRGNGQSSIKATFFILGWLAQRYPSLVREIVDRGHEIASHGYNHVLCNQQNRADLAQDLVKSKKLLEDISGIEVYGYRAPSFSIDENILEMIFESGYRYDSSYNSFEKHGRYGHINAAAMKRSGIALQARNGFKELPVSNLSVAGQTIPWGGGGYFRLLPFSVFKAGMRRMLKRRKAYLFYLHPWEIDPHQPRVSQISKVAGFKHYLNLDKTYDNLDRLLHDFSACRFVSCRQYLENEIA